MKYKDQSNRQQKVANMIRQSLVEIFTRGRRIDERLIGAKITITDVRVSADLKHANCYFLPFANFNDINSITEALELSKYAIRQQVTESVNLKFSPELRFYYDKGAENAINVDAVLHKVLNS